MSSNKLRLVFLAVLAVLAIPLLYFSLKSEPVSSPPKEEFPYKISNRISVPTQGKDEERRIEHYDTDNVTLMLREIWYKNGITTYIHFRANKTASRMVEYYPAPKDAPDRALKTEVHYEDDGSLFRNHRSLRQDGTLIKKGERQENGTYRTLTYFDDGLKIERVQNFARNKSLIDETIFRQDGSKSRLTLVNKYYEREVTLFRPDQTVWMTVTMQQYFYGGSEGKVWSDDGKKVLYTFSINSYMTRMFIPNPDDTPNLSISFERTQTGHLTINKLTADRQTKYSQVYHRKSGSEHGCGGTYVLKHVDDYAADNTENGKRPFRRIFIADDETTVKAVAFPDQNYYYSGKGVVYELHPSGFVSSKKIYSNHKTIDSEENFPDEKYRESKTEVADRELLQRPAFPCPSFLPRFDPTTKYWAIDSPF